ncbi:hypothetical protein [Bradyrhizobium sp. WSM1743]|uniref:hypothetical protein n=1 Tax=Bradyrhizobium sp. WSM1743 TaxID=318996 RepID=UPI0027379F8E|nr:hypothetical protein [Bradyrhizobium sp. WSM1743]
MTEFDVKRWKKLFLGRHGTTSTADLQVVHPLVENAGDILLEHQLRLDGKQPLLNLRPANSEARARAAKMGFVEVDADNMVLDPDKSDKWVRNSDGEWQRKGTAALYLSKADDSEVVIPRSQRAPQHTTMRMILCDNGITGDLARWSRPI